MKKTKKIVIIVVMTIFLLCILISYQQSTSDYPTEGKYYCADIDAYLTFGDDGMYQLNYGAGTYALYVGYDTRFHFLPQSQSDDRVFLADYFWLQWFDKLYLRVERGFDVFEEDKLYCFDRVQ